MGPTGWLVVIIILVALIAVGYWLRSGGKKQQEEPEEEEPEDAPSPQKRTPKAQEKKTGPEDSGDSKKAEKKAAEKKAEKAAEKKAEKKAEKEKPSTKSTEAEEAAPKEEVEDKADDEEPEEDHEDAAKTADEPETPSEEPPSEKRTAVVDEETRKERLKALKRGLKGTRGGFIASIAKLFKGKKTIDPDLLEKLEEVLLTADVGVRFTDKLMGSIKETLSGQELEDPEVVWSFLKEQAHAILTHESEPFDIDREKPFVIMVIGVNGVGKTTTIAKLASRYVRENRKVLLAAGDTFRAAAVRQLEMWGQRVGAEVVKNDKQGADPSSVVFEAIEKGVEQGADVIIADTAGRLHTKTPLMDELKKVKRVMGKALEGTPHEVLLVLDANTGQNAIQQVKEFDEVLGVSGIALTKLDGTAKGGVILGICEEYEIPVRFIGVGERDDDLRTFDPEDFVDVLFESPESGESAA